jgi:hypothetical protein
VGEKEFVIYLDEAHENRYRHWHVWERGRMVEFRIQYEALITGYWYPVVRYDALTVSRIGILCIPMRRRPKRCIWALPIPKC